MADPVQSSDLVQLNQSMLESLAWELETSQENFSLTFACCNFSSLRDCSIKALHNLSTVPIQELRLDFTARALYTTILQAVQDDPPVALIVLGFERLQDIDQVLLTVNQVREEFRKNFKFPIVFWLNEHILKKFTRLAPDFKSWAKTIVFTLPPESRIALLQQEIDTVFDNILAQGDGSLPRSMILRLQIDVQNLSGLIPEIDATSTKRNFEGTATPRLIIAPSLAASFYFIRGQIASGKNQIEDAHRLYKHSLFLFKQAVQRLPPQSTNGEIEHQRFRLIEQQACVLFHLGLGWRRYAVMRRSKWRQACRIAERYYRSCVNVLEQTGHSEQVAKFIGALGEVLQRTEQWRPLKEIALKALTLHTLNRDSIRLSYAYGLCAEVELAQSKWEEAEKYAEKALQVGSDLDLASEMETTNPLLQRDYFESLYRLLLACAERGLGRISEAKSNLEMARSQCKSTYDPLLHIRILKELQVLLLNDQKLPLEAFKVKQERDSIEYQYGFQPFIGAIPLQPQREVLRTEPTLNETEVVERGRELSTSGREEHIKQLWERIGQSYYSLIILYGQSGVGRTSLLVAGLVPKLRHETMGDKCIVPVVLSSYVDWVSKLGQKLSNAYHEVKPRKPSHRSQQLQSTEAILEQLKKHNEQNLLTVLIFDQFENFFNIEKTDREAFFVFLEKCLAILGVTVIISITDVALAELLELAHHAGQAKRPSDLALEKEAYEVLENVLQKKHLYYIRNFLRNDAKKIIQGLTNRSEFKIEDKLVDILVRDLADGTDEIRPIELQVVGSQLQKQEITTLAEYQQKGPKDKLVQKFLDEVVNDCGEDNKQIANVVLSLLTDESDRRPIRTCDEIITDAYNREYLREMLPEEVRQRVELVLEIFFESGLVSWIEDIQIKRYQLIHEYLVSFIHQNQKAKLQAQVQNYKEQLEKEKKKREKAQRKELNTARISAGVFLLVCLVIFFLWRQAQEAKVEAQEATMNAKLNSIRAMISSAKANLAQHSNFEATLDSLRATDLLIPTNNKEEKSLSNGLDEKHQIIRRSNLAKLRKELEKIWQPLIYGLREFNRFEDGSNTEINSISVNPADNTMIAIGSKDGTIKIWHRSLERPKNQRNTTEAVHEIFAAKTGVTSVRFSPDGNLLASAHPDGTVRIWQTGNAAQFGNERSLIRHKTVTSVSFSPDSNLLATAGKDGIVKIWNTRSGNQVQTLTGHTGRVTSVSFSPDDEKLASAGEDGIVKIWNTRNGNQVQTLTGHTGKVTSVSFSPDGKKLASASGLSPKLLTSSGSASPIDRTIRVWSVKDGKEILPPLVGHTLDVTSVSFSCDGKTIASASEDKTVKLWSSGNGALLETLEGHKLYVKSVDFGCDRKQHSIFIASAGKDNTVRLWNDQETNLIQAIPNKSNQVSLIRFSPNGKEIAVASQDFKFGKSTIQLWDAKTGALLGASQEQPLILDLKMSSSGTLASCSTNRTNGEIIVNLWKLNDAAIQPLTVRGQEVEPLQGGHRGFNCRLSVSPDGKQLASTDDSGFLTLWDLTTGKEKMKPWDAHPRSIIGGLSFSSDGKFLASAGNDGKAKIWNTADATQFGSDFKDRNKPIGEVANISFSSTKDSPLNIPLVAIARKDGMMRLWSLNGVLLKAWQAEAQAENNKSEIDIAFRSDKFRDRPDGPDSQTPDEILTSGRMPSSKQTDTDGTLLKAWGKDGTLLQTINLDKVFGIDGLGGNAISVSPDGRRIAIASSDQTIKILKVEHPQYLKLEALRDRTCALFSNYLQKNPNVVRESDRNLCSPNT